MANKQKRIAVRLWALVEDEKIAMYQASKAA